MCAPPVVLPGRAFPVLPQVSYHLKHAGVPMMEDVLDLSQRPYDPRHPLVNMDEKPVQLIQETRTPLPAKPGKPQRYDYEYERLGTANVFLFTEPLAGWRTIEIAAQRTAIDWAQQIKPLLDGYYPDADKVTLVCDNLNTHKIASLYEAFAPQRLEGSHDVWSYTTRRSTAVG